MQWLPLLQSYIYCTRIPILCVTEPLSQAGREQNQARGKIGGITPAILILMADGWLS